MIWVKKWYAPDLPYQLIGWPSWPVWRWAQRYPEDIGYRDAEEIHWREAA